ncbi:MAG TPA: RDD family protein [Gaiellaceae bacterium]|nr:RDD family protein [Gaiellaceae bacterium]
MRLPRAARAVAQSGRNVLSDEVERAIDAMLAGPLPESVARSIVQHRVLERVVAAAELDQAVARALDSPAVQRALAGAIDSPLAEALAVQIAQSEAFSRALREAVAHQTAGFGAELAEALRRRARNLDDAVGRRRAETSRFGGLVSRAVGLVVDAGLAQLTFLVVAASVGLVLALADSIRPGWVEGAIAGGGWGVVVAVYFVSFWTATGQTPGMRIMRVRVVRADGGHLSVWRSLVRLVGLVLAIAPLFAGFLPVLVDRRRRALPDYLAGTVVRAE